MALPSVDAANYPTPTDLHEGVLQALRFVYANAGLEINLLPGSDHYLRAQKYCDRASIAIANNKLSLANFSPLTATEEDLTSLAGVFGVVRRDASGATGYVLVSGTSGTSVTIPSGFRCISPSGHIYETTSANTITLTGTTALALETAPSIQVQAVGTGASTDQDAGTKLTWADASIGALALTCTVADDEIDGGADTDTDETLRSRLLRHLARPPVGGNASSVAQWAEESTSSVEIAYVYCAAGGPGSLDVCVTKAGGDRTVSAAVLNTVAAYIVGQQPGQVEPNVTAIDEQGVDVLLTASLPLPQSAGGAGGGWIDPAPWPAGTFAAGSNDGRVSAPSGNTFTVRTTLPPIVGQSFGIWNSDDQVMVEFEATAVSGVSGAYVVTVASRPSWVIAGTYVSAGAISLVTYAEDFLAAMNLLGPGEKTTNIDILPRGRRQPGPDFSNPAALTNIQLNAVTTEHSEMLNLEYAARFATGTTTPLTAPSVPAATADAPRLLTLKEFAIRSST